MWGEELHGYRVDIQVVDLSNTDHLTYRLSGHFERAELSSAQILESGNLVDSYFAGARLIKTNLANAMLMRTHLESAIFTSSNLEHANLIESQLQGAYLEVARCNNAKFSGANL